MIYCAKNRIVFTNTIDQRFKLTLQDSVPDFRDTLFPSLYKAPIQRREKKEHHEEAHVAAPAEPAKTEVTPAQ